MNLSRVELDVLIIGAGGGGLRAALELSSEDLDTLVLGKREFGDAHTVKAAGGINASLGNLDPEDSWEIHAADTLREGHFINDPEAVAELCQQVPGRVQELRDWGCNFDLTEEGEINQRYFGAQAYRRTCFVGDRTGEAIEETLVNRVKEAGVAFRNQVFITKILAENGAVTGAVGFDRSSGEVIHFRTGTIILAAGGLTNIYARSSSRKWENTGDGPALAYQAGASLQDMEMVQFHPTGMVKPEEQQGSLVTEAVRGEGGRLYNTSGERFMERYSPQQMELDARDVVARSIHREIQQGNGTPDGGVYLDISHRDPDFIRKRLPALLDKFAETGIDPTQEPMEVAPTAHYPMGGVRIDFPDGETAVEGLFAVGEVTAGVHGANRLGGNSLAEVVTFGKTVAQAAGKFSRDRGRPTHSEDKLRSELERLQKLEHSSGRYEPLELISRLRDVMWENVGIVRSADKLDDALQEIGEIREQAKDLQVHGGRTQPDFSRALELHFMLPVAEATIRSAKLRNESRGAHYREDHPKKEEEWRLNLICADRGEGMQLEKSEVGRPDPRVQEALDRDLHLDYHHLE